VSDAVPKPLGPYTVDDWLAMDQPEDGSRLELIGGYLFVSPVSDEHPPTHWVDPWHRCLDSDLP
jgi:hypothetical protein